MAEPTVQDPTQAYQPPVAQDPALQAQAPVAPIQGPGAAQLEALIAQSSGAAPPIADVAKIVQLYPQDRAQLMTMLQQTYGNGYTYEVITAATPPLAATDGLEPAANGSVGSGIKTGAAPKLEVKNPGDKVGSGISTKEANNIDFVHGDPAQGKLPPPPAALYNDGDPRDGAQRAKDGIATPPQNYVGTNIPVQPAIPTTPDLGKTEDGMRTTASVDTTRGPGSMSTVTATSKTTAIDDQSAEAKTAAFTKYKAAVGKELDAQIAALEPKRGAMPEDPNLNPQQAHDDLVAAKAKLAGATGPADVAAIAKENNLLISPIADQRVAIQIVSTKGTNAAALLDGSAIAADNKKTTVVTSTPGGDTTTAVTDKTNEVSTKGVNIARGTTTTDQHADGSTDQKSSKLAVTGGIIDPLAAKQTWSSTHQNADGTGTAKTASVGGTAADGFGGGTGSVSATELGTGRSVSATGKAGVIQDDKGTGVKAGIDDARMDAGTKSVSAGVFGAADGSFQMSVTPTADGGCSITMTTTVHGKAGAFAGKRDPSDPVLSGNETHGGGAAYVEGSQVVSRTRVLSKDEATAILGDLDALASSNQGGKRVFGTRAAVTAGYARVFGGSLDDLGKADGQADRAGDSVTKVTETGWGVDAKGGGSTGNDASSRTGGDVSGGYSSTTIKGHQESATADSVTRKVVCGGRTSWNANGSANEGVANMGGGVSGSDQKTRTYVFTVPKTRPDLLEEMRKLPDGDEAAAKAFASAHSEVSMGVVEGSVEQDGSNVSAGVGPLGVKGGTTSTVDTNVAKGHHTVTDANGQKREVKDLSGTAEGSRKDDSSASVAGVKLAQGNTTATAKGTVDADGQASLDVTQSSSDSHVSTDTLSKNATDLGKKDKTDLATMGATGGPMAYVKKLAERVGEVSTVGAHFDNEAFNQLVGCAGDQAGWSKAINSNYRSEWFALGNALRSPHPPKDWLDQDESPDHLAAYQLTRMKAFATFVSVAGPAGKEAISRARGEYGPNAIGTTVSFPPSLQDQRPIYDDLCKQVEHLRPTLLGFAQAGDDASGHALLDKLGTDLGAIRQKIGDAADHEDPTLGVRAANGIGQMQGKVAAWRPKFDQAIEAHKMNQPVDAALDGQKVATSTQLAKAQDDDKTVVAAARADTAKLEAVGPQKTHGQQRASDKQWADFDKQHAASMQTEQQAEEKQKADHDAETRARAEEAKQAAEAKIPSTEQGCALAKGKAWGLLDQAYFGMPKHFYSSDDTFAHLLRLGTLMREWSQEWQALKGLYQDAGHDPAARDDLRPGLSATKLQEIHDNDEVKEQGRFSAGDLKRAWGR